MAKDRTDRFLEGAGYVVALVRILRGEKPDQVVAQTRDMADKAQALRRSINAHMGEPESASDASEESAHG